MSFQYVGNMQLAYPMSLSDKPLSLVESRNWVIFAQGYTNSDRFTYTLLPIDKLHEWGEQRYACADLELSANGCAHYELSF